MNTTTRGWWNTDPTTMDDDTLFAAYRDSRDAWDRGIANTVGGPEVDNAGPARRINAAILAEMVARMNAGRITESAMLAGMKGTAS